jgi:hypothetical protein
VVEVPERVARHGCLDGLRLRRCCDPSCNAVFAICRSCDHGQRYCSADLRYARPSVYFEAGYAERSVPVIYTVRRDHFRA